MTTTKNSEARKATLFARTTTATLVQSALMLDALGQNITADERLTLAWIRDEMETRMGGITEELADAFDALLDTELTYTECLLVTFPALTA